MAANPHELLRSAPRSLLGFWGVPIVDVLSVPDAAHASPQDVTAQEKFDELVRDGVWPFLRAQDFKRTKANFHRAVGDNWQVVNLQKSAWSDRDSVRFTVNLAVAFDRLRDGVHDWAEGKRPPESRCHLRERLGFLLRDEDVWWDVDPRTDVAALADTINTALEQYALPWLDARSTDEALRELLRSDEGLRAEPSHHLYWFEKRAAQLGDEELVRRIVTECERKEAELENSRELEDTS